MKIIPAIDLMEGAVVRLLRGDPAQKTVYDSDPLRVALRWEKQGADMLHIVDLDAALERGTNLEMIRKIASSVSIPVEVAGGLRDEKIIADMATVSDRMVVGTLAFSDRPALERLLGLFGSEKIVISVDHIGGNIAVRGWQEKTGIVLHDAVNDFVDMGLSEFLLTDVDRDGTMRGPDTEHLEKICAIPGTNVIASGGISGIDDVRRVGEIGPYGVILGKALYENKISIQEAVNL